LNLEALYEELLVMVAKVDKVQADQLEEVKTMKVDVQALNDKAEHSLDAAKLVRVKVNSFLASK
jgi:hypothetical protein